jgi:predicted membrane protein
MTNLIFLLIFMHNFTSRLIVGSFFILLGLGIFSNQIGLSFFGFNIFNLWPIILIVVGIVLLINRKIFAASFLLIVGFAFLFSTIFNFNFFTLVWPLLIIMIGISILFKPQKYYHDWDKMQQMHEVSKDHVNESVFFWGLNETIKSDNFMGGKIDCVFGGFKLDLRNVKLTTDNVFLEVNTVFGGGELILPRDIRVQIESASVMGGVTNNTVSGKAEDKLLRIKASAVFGGIEIKN